MFPFALIHNAEDVVLAHDEIVFPVDLDFRATKLADEHLVALLDFEGNLLAAVIGLTRADGNDFALLGLFLGGIGDDNPAFLRFLLFQWLDQNAVSNWFDHVISPLLGFSVFPIMIRTTPYDGLKLASLE